MTPLPQQPPALSPPSVVEESPQLQEKEQELPGPSARTLERYLNDSLHAWFRQEFLMEYEAEAGRLLCMVCRAELPSLHLDHIKSHVLETHPNSLVFSSEEKHCILQAWAQTHGENVTKYTQKMLLVLMEICCLVLIDFVVKEGHQTNKAFLSFYR